MVPINLCDFKPSVQFYTRVNIDGFPAVYSRIKGFTIEYNRTSYTIPCPVWLKPYMPRFEVKGILQAKTNNVNIGLINNRINIDLKLFTFHIYDTMNKGTIFPNRYKTLLKVKENNYVKRVSYKIRNVQELRAIEQSNCETSLYLYSTNTCHKYSFQNVFTRKAEIIELQTDYQYLSQFKCKTKEGRTFYCSKGIDSIKKKYEFKEGKCIYVDPDVPNIGDIIVYTSTIMLKDGTVPRDPHYKYYIK